MPYRPKRPCRHPGCPELSHTGWCPRHQPAEQRIFPKTRPSLASRGYTRQWRELRAVQLARYPYCAWCGAPATQVDHSPAYVQGTDHRDYTLTSCCQRHHSMKTLAENNKRRALRSA